MSHALAASKAVLTAPKIDLGRLAGVALASVIAVGLVGILASAVDANDCVGTALSQAEIVLPTLIG